MRILLLIFVLAFIGGCNQRGASEQAAPEETLAEPLPSRLSDADKAEIFRALQLMSDAQGRVVNDCNEVVTPRLIAVDLGEAIGVAQLIIIPGGPNTAGCYGDVPGDMHLLMRDDMRFRVIFSGRGYIGVLSSGYNDAPDIALRRPGFTFPVFEWDGSQYLSAGRSVSDKEFDAAARYP